MTGPIYYLDYAAATPVDERALSAMAPFYTELFFNPSSPYSPAIAVRREYEAAKSRLAKTFGARGEELIMTAGATESINLAFSGITGHVVTTAIEHDAVLAAARRQDATFVEPSARGSIDPLVIAQAITPQTQLVSVQLANNEIGTIQPLRAISQVVDTERSRRRDAGETTPIYFHSDGSQGFGHIEVNVARLGVDMLTLNSAKIYGPKQVGLLWVKPGTAIHPVIVGGGQEKGLRSGTENVPGVIGFSRAAELAVQSRAHEAERLSSLRDGLEQRLIDAFETLVVSGQPKKRLPGSLHVSLPGLDGERLVFRLESRGVLVATGSACAANKGTRSHVLQAIGLSDTEADGSLRITLGRFADEAIVSKAGDILIEEITDEYKRVASA